MTGQGFKILFAIGLAALLGACVSMGNKTSCSEESLTGMSWQADWRKETWTFYADGTLACEGICDYGAGFGYPERWEGDSEANLWSGGVEYLRLHFTEKSFAGTDGAFRCDVANEGRELILDPLAGQPLTFRQVAP